MAAFCCNCKEDFELAEPHTAIRMGLLFPLSRMPARIADRFREWKDDDEGAFMCGNCYFDLTYYD